MVSSDLVYEQAKFFLYVMGGLLFALFFMLRKEVSLILREKMRSGKGYGYIRMLMPDRQEKMFFVNLKNGVFDMFDRTYMVDVASGTFRPTLINKDDKKEKSFFKLFRGVADKLKSRNPEDEEIKQRILEDIDKNLKSRSSGAYKMNLEAITFKGKAPVYTYLWDRSEPVDLYDMQKSYDSATFNAAIIRAKAVSGMKDFLAQNKRLTYILFGTAIAALAAAYFAYETNQAIAMLAAAGG